MRKLNPEYVKAVCLHVNQSPYFTLLSMELQSFDIGTSRVEIQAQEKHLQPFKLVHGGVYSTIIDAATFWAVYGEIDEDVGMTSVDLKLNYLSSATSGKLIATGRRIKVGRTLGLGEAEVTDENGKILAHGMSTVMVLPGLALAAGKPLPKKFE
jgi:uncharacterized protein (TIGR00369 family)